MARTFTRASQNYAAGVFGPFAVDGFTRADTDYLEATFTVENWPAGYNPIMLVQVRWDDGSGGDFGFASAPKARDGSPLSQISMRAYVPQLPNGKAAVTSGNVTVQLFAPLRTAVTLRAVAGP